MDFVDEILQGAELAPGTPGWDLLLDAVFYNESRLGTDRRVRKPNKEGSIGGYQIREGTFDFVRRNFPEKYGRMTHADLTFDDFLGRQVASDYLTLNRKAITRRGFLPTLEHMLATYNAGDGIYRKNTKVGPGVQKYIDSGLGFIGTRRKR